MLIRENMVAIFAKSQVIFHWLAMNMFTKGNLFPVF